jgi:outer membrane receptor protein involved in Fe transport
MKKFNGHSASRLGLGLTTALLASTALSSAPAFAQQAPDNGGVQEVIVTASKREETLQKVPMSIQALDTRKLEQLNVTEFQDYVKYLPSVSYQTIGPNQTSIYMRGVSSGDNANHSGPLPSVGVYLDEQPITTIGGTLDVHVYDIARVEVLPGPQGTLYGASSEAGTLRIITNKPSTNGFSAGYDLEGNTVDHGGQGYVAEGFVNVPLASNAAIRLVGWDEHDAGYIDNVPGVRTFATSGDTVSNAAIAKNNYNTADTIGGRAALKIDLNSNWTIEPTLIAQDQRNKGVFGFEPSVGDLKVQRFQPDTDHDKWAQAALTVLGKIGKYDLTYSGGYFIRDVHQNSDYTDYSIAYDAAYGSGHYWQDANGNPLPRPLQEIHGIDHFSKFSHEARIASPATDRFRFIAGLFYERQTHWIIQDYEIQGFGPQISVPGFPNTIWLTDQQRIDRDDAAFGEASYDITSKLTLTAGIRGYEYSNYLKGFYGFSEGYNALTGFSSGMGDMGQNCKAGLSFRNAPCVNLSKPAVGSGETHKVNLTYKFDDQRLIYATYSTGYRPGGVNRSGDFGAYQSDKLTNYEVGFKTSWLDRRLVFNGAFYEEDWNSFQFSFLGPNSLTIIENAPQATIKGVETSIDWRATSHLTFSGGAAYNDAELTKNFCGTDQATSQLITSCANSAAVAVKGAQLPYTPSFKGNLTARYTFQVRDWDAHVQGSVVYQDKNYVGLRTADSDALGTMPGYAAADFAIGAVKDGLSVELFVKNAFDERGQVNRYTPCTVAICASSYNNVSPTVAPAVYVIPIQPMTIGIRFGQKF